MTETASPRLRSLVDALRRLIADLPKRVGGSFTSIVGAAETAFGRVFDVFTVGILCTSERFSPTAD